MSTSDVHPAAENLDDSPEDVFLERVRTYNTFAPEVQNVDLGPFMNRVREECPVARGEDPIDFWMVSRYEDVNYILHHPEIFSSKRTMYPFGVEEVSIAFNDDPPLQTGYHRVMALGLSAPQVLRMEPTIREHAKARLAEVKAKGSCEFVGEFATPMVLGALLECCGLESDRLSKVIAWMSRFFTTGLGQDDPSLWEEYSSRTAEAEGYIAEIIEHRKGGDGIDPISQMTRAKIDRRPVTDEELVRMATFLVTAGVDTTATMTSNIVAWLAQHPDRQQELRDKPELLPTAVEEFMRYEHMLSNGRVVTQDTEIRGVEMKAGDYVMLLLPATGRDPRVFECPEEIRFDRAPNPHLGFGAGVHRCIGMHLARAEIRIALEELNAGVASYLIDPADEVKRRRGPIAGVWHLPLVFR